MHSVCVEEYVINEVIDRSQKKSGISKKRIHDGHSDKTRVGKDGSCNKYSFLFISELGLPDKKP